MLSNKEEKQYGLILPKKQQSIAPKVSNVFGDNDESDEEEGTDWVKKALQAEEEKNRMKKQTRLNMQKALKEDPTIFQYDEVYDEMEKTKEESKETREEKKRPRYIQNLLKAAERRKKEQEYRIERMVQKEREAEGAMYADKESFVTSAYRAKLEEFKKMEEEETKMDRLEAIGDVKKQQDMSGFYRHLYQQTVEAPHQKSDAKNNINTENLHDDAENLDEENTNITVANKDQIKSKEMKKARQYRQRVVKEDSDTDTETQEKKENATKVVVPEKRKETESEDKELKEVEPEVKKQKQQTEDDKSDHIRSKDKEEGAVDTKNTEEESKDSESAEKAEKASISAKAKIEAEKKERSKIWEKRTVGPAFEAALQRYYARKAERLSAA